MTTFNYKFVFGKQKFQIRIQASCAAEAKIKFNDYICENVMVVSKSKTKNTFGSIGCFEELSMIS